MLIFQSFLSILLMCLEIYQHFKLSKFFYKCLNKIPILFANKRRKVGPEETRRRGISTFVQLFPKSVYPSFADLPESDVLFT